MSQIAQNVQFFLASQLPPKYHYCPSAICNPTCRPFLSRCIMIRWFARLKSSSSRKGRQPRRLPLRLEQLEDRLVPAIVTVTTVVDDITPNDGTVSLREAI